MMVAHYKVNTIRSLLAAALFLSAGSAFADTAEVALVGDSSEVQGCQRLGEVEASSLLTGVMASQGRKRTIATLKERAAELGATHVQVLSSNFSYASNNMLGVAYRCLSDQAKPPPTAN